MPPNPDRGIVRRGDSYVFETVCKGVRVRRAFGIRCDELGALPRARALAAQWRAEIEAGAPLSAGAATRDAARHRRALVARTRVPRQAARALRGAALAGTLASDIAVRRRRKRSHVADRHRRKVAADVAFAAAALARIERLLGDDMPSADTIARLDPLDLLVVRDYVLVDPAGAGRHRGLSRMAWAHNWRVASNADRVVARGACRAAVWRRVRELVAEVIAAREAA